MAKPRKKDTYREHHRQVAIYMTEEEWKLLNKEAQERRRKLGPTALEIIWEYFQAKQALVADAQTPAA